MVHYIHYLKLLMKYQLFLQTWGFYIEEGSLTLKTDYYNFTALNIPLEHPARQEHDTFYLQPNSEGARKVLRNSY